MTKVKFDRLKIHLVTHLLLLYYYVSHILDIDHCVVMLCLEYLDLKISVKDYILLLMLVLVLKLELCIVVSGFLETVYVFIWKLENEFAILLMRVKVPFENIEE